MNIVILSDHARTGGAAQATCRIAASLGQPNRVVFFGNNAIATEPALHVLWHDESALERNLYRLPRKLMPQTFPRPHSPEFAAERLRAKLRELAPDIINVHNLHAAAPWGWGPHLFNVCLEFAPVVWTLHDMWSFTGRCAYSYDCAKFITGCDASCPTPTEAPALPPEQIRAAWEERRAIYARHRNDLAIVTPSRWLADQARRGMFAQHRIEVIPYGLDTNSFAPASREDARRALGLEVSGSVLLLAAHDLGERRKGADILPLLWQQIQHRPLTILTMGQGRAVFDDERITVHSLGYLDDDLRKSLAYSAADALLHPAPVDNFPNVVLEAMACGTPTIALPVGGLPEMVRPNATGWLADAATPEALARAVDLALGDIASGISMRDSCRARAENDYSLELQRDRYLQLFQELHRR